MFKSVIVGFVLVLGIAIAVFALQAGQPENLNSKVKQILKQNKLVVGTDAVYPPMESLDKDGKIVGFDVDLVSEIAKQLGVEVEFKNIAWDELFKVLESGQIDLAVSSITITPERSKTWLFSKPYFSSGQSILVAKTNTQINGPSDLKDKKVAAQKDTTGETEALKYVSNKQLERFVSDFDPLVERLETGKLDALVIDYPVAVDIALAHPSLRAIKPFTNEFYGLVFRKDSSQLVALIDKVLSDLKTSGKQKEIELKWFK